MDDGGGRQDSVLGSGRGRIKKYSVSEADETECDEVRRFFTREMTKGARHDTVCKNIEIFKGKKLFVRHTRDDIPSLREIQQAIRTDGGGKHHREIGVGGGSNTNASSKISRAEGVKRSVSEADETDSRGKRLTTEQVEFFKDSKIRDRRGDLLRQFIILALNTMDTMLTS